MKPFPLLQSDQDAEDFVADGDLTEYDLSEMVKMRFERSIEPSTVAPTDLSTVSREQAAHFDVSSDAVVSSAIQRAPTID